MAFAILPRYNVYMQYDIKNQMNIKIIKLNAVDFLLVSKNHI